MLDGAGAPSEGVAARLIFPAALRQQLIDHAREGQPDEVCGVLAGQGDRVTRVFRVRNRADEVSAERGVFRDRSTGQASAGRRPVHYYMDPHDLLPLYRQIDDLALDVVGYYHSHTHTEARPSPTDIRLATDLISCYVLVSLQDPNRPAVRAWRIHKDDPSDEAGHLTELELGEADAPKP